jgi:putative ABC transport system substrate-binding protein
VNPRRRLIPAALAVLMAMIPVLLAAAPAGAEDVLVIKSRHLGLYDRAVDGVLGSYRADLGERVRVLNLETADPDAPVTPPPDVVIAVGAAAARHAAKHFPETPIVYTMVVRPDRLEMTPYTVGISMFERVADLVATLNLVSPNIRFVGVLHGPEHRKMIGDAIDGLKGYETRLVPVEVDDERDLPRLARRLVLQCDALWIAPGTVTGVDAFQFLLKLSFEHRVPLVADTPAVVQSGALLAVTPDPVDMGRQAARLAGYLLSGEGLPPDRLFYPDVANLAINVKTARSLGIEVPPVLVDFASLVVK